MQPIHQCIIGVEFISEKSDSHIKYCRLCDPLDFSGLVQFVHRHMHPLTKPFGYREQYIDQYQSSQLTFTVKSPVKDPNPVMIRCSQDLADVLSRLGDVMCRKSAPVILQLNPSSTTSTQAKQNKDPNKRRAGLDTGARKILENSYKIPRTISTIGGCLPDYEIWPSLVPEQASEEKITRLFDYPTLKNYGHGLHSRFCAERDEIGENE